MKYDFIKFDPVPYSKKSIYGSKKTNKPKDLIVLDVEGKYEFIETKTKKTYHSYPISSDDHILHCGGYLDKILKWRDKNLISYLCKNGINNSSFSSKRFKILKTRSPQLDLLVIELFKYFFKKNGFKERVIFFDHGCSVSEHLDLLKIMVDIVFNNEFRIEDILDYTGLDHSSFCLMASKLFHETFDTNFYKLICKEGSEINFSSDTFDISLSVGVVNHVKDPVSTLSKIISTTKYFVVLGLWVTSNKNGIWRISHGQTPFYFFSKTELHRIKKKFPDGDFYFSQFIPDVESTQKKSYVGISYDELKETGCYHMIFSKVKDCKFLNKLNKFI
tara:strand:+ start:692 stop:1687 length:996 start_codon:yes stop_codon:yes gene_type:complete